ncbi:MAG: carboxypeptidase regulatory-like domain-containing protein [Elusimicrobiota bacterium]
MNSRLNIGRRVYSGSQAGVTLIEMMVSVVILSVGILGLIASFGSIQKSMQLSKGKTLASNLAQEKLHILMQKPYMQVIPTPNPSGVNTDYVPNISYDTSYFPIEYILQGGITYKRLTYIQGVRENSGILDRVSPETPDTGMRLITITILWTEGGDRRRLELSSVLSNPDSVMGNSALTGLVTIDATATPIVGALVVVAENTGWRDSTNASGLYSIILSPGNATLMASAPGYYTKYTDVTAVANASVATNISLVAIASGSVSGTAWVNPGLVISQVVSSTTQANGYVAQYIELFNPTTAAITIGGDPPPIKLNFQAPAGCTGTVTCAHPGYGLKLTYVNNSIAAGGYYVVANTTNFTTNGVTVTADAYFTDNANTFCATLPGAGVWNPPTARQIIIPSHGGSVWLTETDGYIVDSVGWSHNANTPPVYETNYFALTTGLVADTQVIRTSSPSFFSSAYGRAYDSGQNTVDFTTMTLQYRAFSTADAAQPVIAGVPAIGAVVSANDGLSSPTTAYSSGWPPSAVFSVPHVATGTWTVLISSGEYVMQETDSIPIAATGSTFVFPSSTTLLDGSGVYGFISGTVVDADGVALAGSISVSPGTAGSPVTTTSGGRYWLAVTPGVIDITANPSNANPSYVSASSANVTAVLGQITNGVNFTLSQGGRFSGFVSRDGNNALSGVAIMANDANEISRDVQVSDVNGRFLTINIATGTYRLTPVVDSLETSTPTYITATVTAGGTVEVGTFTITGALGTISGTVTAGGSPIATGVLIVVTTKTLTGTPPAPPSLSTASLSDAGFYLTSSREDGTYSVDVRQSTNPVYNIYGYYYSTINTGADAATSQTTTAGILAGQTTGQHNLAW